MRYPLSVGSLSVGMAGAAIILSGAAPRRVASDLTVHEWGTFTSIAGTNGKAMSWAPFDGPSELPCFVTMLNPAGYKGPVASALAPPDHSILPELHATVRMETPVLYFYSTHDQTVNVHVDFPHGLITEWYPQARATPSLLPIYTDSTNDDQGKLSGVTFGPTVPFATTTGTIDWTGVEIRPAAHANYPVEPGTSHYYAARATDAAPIRVGAQDEKFLFYRGIASFDIPIAAKLARDGRVAITKNGTDSLGLMLLFQKRGDSLGFRIVPPFGQEATVPLPALTADIASLRAVLVKVLMNNGLYEREAQAMIETWHDSWFENGTRLIYVLPKQTVDAKLPLTITPAPGAVARVFVGRLELITPDEISGVEHAIATNNITALASYGRFLEPISRRFISGTLPADLNNKQVNAALGAVEKLTASKARVCGP